MADQRQEHLQQGSDAQVPLGEARETSPRAQQLELALCGQILQNTGTRQKLRFAQVRDKQTMYSTFSKSRSYHLHMCRNAP